jgi:hypothetical protein
MGGRNKFRQAGVCLEHQKQPSYTYTRRAPDGKLRLPAAGARDGIGDGGVGPNSATIGGGRACDHPGWDSLTGTANRGGASVHDHDGKGKQSLNDGQRGARTSGAVGSCRSR